MSNPKDQHWVPQCYLRQWCDKNAIGERAWVFPHGGGAGALRPIKDLFRKPHLYTIRTRPAPDPYGLEKSLSQLESLYAQVIRNRVMAALPLRAQDRGVLCVFFATMLARTRKQGEHWRGQWQRVLDVGDDMMENMRKMSPEQRTAAAAASHKPLGGDGLSMSMDDMRKMVQEPLPHLVPGMTKAAVRILPRMQLHVLTTDTNPGFITSDCPAVMFDPTAHLRPPMWRSPGLANENIEVTLPLSPRHLLLFCWTAPEGSISAPMPEDLVDEFNRRAQFHCGKLFVVQRNTTKPYWFQADAEPAAAAPSGLSS